VNVEVVLEGVLSKRSNGMFQRWQKRHFALSGKRDRHRNSIVIADVFTVGHYLKYYQDSKRLECKGAINLTAIKGCASGEGADASKIILQMSDDAELVVCILLCIDQSANVMSCVCDLMLMCC
jgi:hypothetical protein